jgi:hypothetical protein
MSVWCGYLEQGEWPLQPAASQQGTGAGASHGLLRSRVSVPAARQTRQPSYTATGHRLPLNYPRRSQTPRGTRPATTRKAALRTVGHVSCPPARLWGSSTRCEHDSAHATAPLGRGSGAAVYAAVAERCSTAVGVRARTLRFVFWCSGGSPSASSSSPSPSTSSPSSSSSGGKHAWRGVTKGGHANANRTAQCRACGPEPFDSTARLLSNSGASTHCYV